MTGRSPQTIEGVLLRLREALRDSASLQLAVLFGSRATGRSRGDSDYDIGVVPNDARWSLADELSLAAALSAATDAEVDLVRLDEQEPLLGREVASHGICLFEAAPGVFSAYRATAMSRWIDFDEMVAPHRARFLKRLARPPA
jgi:predicted nucleotidyltransferase